MNKLLIICKDYTPPLVDSGTQDLITEYWAFLVPGEKTMRLYRGGAYEEFTLEEAQEKLRQVYETVDYIVYQQKKVEYLSTFYALIDNFKEYTSPEVGVIYSDYYRAGQGVNIHYYNKNFTPESFVMNIPPVVVVNKKYLPGLPLQMNQELAAHLTNSCPILHFPESTYILNE